MCLVFRAIVLLSVNWWVVSVVAQEKQDVIITGTTGSAQTSSAIQAQQPLVENKKPEGAQAPGQEVKKPEQEIKKTEEPKKEEVKKEEAKKDEVKKQEEVKKSEEAKTPAEKKLEVVQPSVEAKKDLSAIALAKEEELKKEEVTKKPDEVKKSEEVKTPSEETQKPAQAKQAIAQPSVENKKEEAKKEEKSKTLEAEEEEIKGIDTVDLEEPRGNWLFKRIWWNRAENKYEKIRTLFGNILEARIQFFTKRSTASSDLFAPFYFEVGMNNGELQETVSQLLKHIENERKKEGDLRGSALEIFNVLLREKKSLESINADVLTIHKLDVDIDETLKKLMEQIDRARKYEREAWNSFKDIAHVLSDKKARELFYQMDTAHNNLKDIQEYVNQALSVHLDRVVGMAKSQIERIKSTIDKLKKEGHDLKTLADQASGKAPIKSAPAQEEELEEESEEEEQGFFARTFSAIKSGFVAVWDTVVYVVTLPFSWFSSGESSESDEQETVGEEEISESEEEEKS